MSDRQERTRLLIGEDGLLNLAGKSVALFGLGGVGGMAAEMLARAGVGHLTIVDFDRVGTSNINRQLVALTSTVDRPKVAVMAARLADINPDCDLDAREAFFGPENHAEFGLGSFDLVLDCIDSLNPKTALIRHTLEAGTPLITSCGAGGRIDNTGVEVRDLFTVVGDPLARHLKKRLRRLGITGPIPAVASPVAPVKALGKAPEPGIVERGRERTPVGTISCVPPVFGAVMASWTLRFLLGMNPPLAKGE